MMGNSRPRDGMADLLADEGPVPLVVGVDGHRRVAEHRLRPRRGHHDLARPIGQRVGEAPQLALVVLLVVDLEVGERSVAPRAPVDELLLPVDEPLLVQAHEDLAHRPGEPLVHGEALALPVEGGAQRLVLLADPRAVLLLPGPDAPQELGAPQVVAALLLAPLDLLLDDHLRGDAGVVGAGQPQHVEAAHPLPAAQDVLERGREGVAEVEGARHVGRGQHDAEGGARPVVRVGVEVVPLLPEAVPARLDVAVLVGLGELGRNRVVARHDRITSPRPRPARRPACRRGGVGTGPAPRPYWFWRSFSRRSRFSRMMASAS